MLLLTSLILLSVLVPRGPQAADLKTVADYLRTHRMAPADYVVSKFRDHDIVFVGEFHRIRHDPLFIQALMPKLYKAGIRNLGIEFANYSDQPRIDKLITAPIYDEQEARQILFDEYTAWGYVEYEDLFCAAWKLNRSLKPGQPTFRIVGLNYVPRWELIDRPREQLTDEQRKAIWYEGDGDAYMAQTVIKEFVEPGRKALIYSGMHHAFTRYHQPRYDYSAHKLVGMTTARMGNLVYQRISGRAITIFLHSPWQSGEREDQMRPPAAGVIDQAIAQLGTKSAGFDVAGTPLGKIADAKTYYAFGHEGFKLEDYCDGYIYQRPFDKYEGVAVDPLWVTDRNLKQAVTGIPNFAARAVYKSPAIFLEDMRRDADIPARFRLWGVLPQKQ